MISFHCNYTIVVYFCDISYYCNYTNFIRLPFYKSQLTNIIVLLSHRYLYYISYYQIASIIIVRINVVISFAANYYIVIVG